MSQVLSTATHYVKHKQISGPILAQLELEHTPTNRENRTSLACGVHYQDNQCRGTLLPTSIMAVRPDQPSCRCCVSCHHASPPGLQTLAFWTSTRHKTGSVEARLAACALCSQGQLEGEDKLVCIVADLADETTARADGTCQAVALTVVLYAQQLCHQDTLACLLQVLQGVHMRLVQQMLLH